MILLISGDYTGAWKVTANNSETVDHKDLRLGQIVYILVFYNISYSWLLPLDGFQFFLFLRDSENDIYLIVFDRFNDKIRHIDTIFSFSSGVSVVSRLENRPHKRFAYRHALKPDYSGYSGHFLRSCEKADHADCRPCRLRIFFNVSFLFINFFYPNFSSLCYFRKKKKRKDSIGI